MSQIALFLLAVLLLSVQSCSSAPSKQYPDYFESPPLKEDSVRVPVSKNSISVDPHPELIKDPIFAPWLKHQDRLISRLWKKPFKKPVICRIDVSKAGILMKAEIKQSSGSDAEDQVALDLLRSLPQLVQLPAASNANGEAFLVKFTHFPDATFDRIVESK